MRFNSLSLCALRYFVRYNLTVAREPKESHEIMHRSTLRFQGNVDIGTSDRKTWKEEEEESPPTEEIRNSWLLASKQHEMIR